MSESRYQARFEVLRGKVIELGVNEPTLRADVMARGAGGLSPITEPYDALSRQIGEASYLVTDDQVAAVRMEAGSDKAAFEVVFAASVGAGLARWEAALRAVEGLDDASA